MQKMVADYQYLVLSLCLLSDQTFLQDMLPWRELRANIIIKIESYWSIYNEIEDKIILTKLIYFLKKLTLVS